MMTRDDLIGSGAGMGRLIAIGVSVVVSVAALITYMVVGADGADSSDEPESDRRQTPAVARQDPAEVTATKQDLARTAKRFVPLYLNRSPDLSLEALAERLSPVVTERFLGGSLPIVWTDQDQEMQRLGWTVRATPAKELHHGDIAPDGSYANVEVDITVIVYDETGAVSTRHTYTQPLTLISDEGRWKVDNLL
jgi:hypothetical protein